MPSILPLCSLAEEVEYIQKTDFLKNYTNETHVDFKYDLYIEKGKGKQQTSGDKRLKSLVQALDYLDVHGYRRSDAQIRFHKAYIGACLKKIYGKDINRDIARLLHEYELDELRSDVILTTPRRFGKTISVALYVAAYLYTQPDCEVSIYSTGRRASKKLLAQIYKMVTILAGSKDIVKVYNQEALEIQGTGVGYSKCYSYPSKVQIDEKYHREKRRTYIYIYI